MAAPERRRWEELPTQPHQAPDRPAPGRTKKSPAERSRALGARRSRVFYLLVVVPVLLMLGSVYTHAVADRLGWQAAELESQYVQAGVESENLEVSLTELSSPERVRAFASGELGMQDPAGELKVYGSNGEDGTENAASRTEGPGSR